MQQRFSPHRRRAYRNALSLSSTSSRFALRRWRRNAARSWSNLARPGSRQIITSSAARAVRQSKLWPLAKPERIRIAARISAAAKIKTRSVVAYLAGGGVALIRSDVFGSEHRKEGLCPIERARKRYLRTAG